MLGVYLLVDYVNVLKFSSGRVLWYVIKQYYLRQLFFEIGIFLDALITIPAKVCRENVLLAFQLFYQDPKIII